MRVGVVAAAYGGSWDERGLVARRLAGALACAADVDVLVPGPAPRSDEFDGGVRLLWFPAPAVGRARQRAWRQVAIRPEPPADSFFACSCLHGRHRQKTLPTFVEEQLLLAEGGDAPELYAHLRSTRYDLVVFVGLHSPTTYWGVRSLADDLRMVLVPAMTNEELIWLQLHAAALDRAERIIVFTEGERTMWAGRLGKDEAKIENIRFVVGINPVAEVADRRDTGVGRFVVIADDWTKRPPSTRLLRWAERLPRDVHPDLSLRIVGPGAEGSPLGFPATASRLDSWRWVSRAMALLDPAPHRLLGVRVLEALLYRTPVIVHAQGGANLEHAKAGGGVWFRTDDEFYAMARALLDADLARVLGEQGRSYVEEEYSDTDGFIKRVGDTFLSRANRDGR